MAISIHLTYEGAFCRFFEISGHSGYEQVGKDIVCAAVSALAQTAILGVIEIAKAKPEYEIKDGYLSCRINDEHAQDTQVNTILDTMVLGLEAVQQQFPAILDITRSEV
ncbi:MAG: ribosomal-processing cysteine protease Prp [Christensenellales bacterium]|jgi:uncharacterized protein YsxB (DUF464 family)